MADRKAQGATEYMIILAIVIVIALIVAAILGVLPGIGGETRSRSGTAYWDSAEVGVVSYSIANDADADNAYVQLRNNLPESITITHLSFDGENISTDSTPIKPGDTAEFSAADVGNPCAARGDFSVNINITYTKASSGDTFYFDGNGRKLEGSCAE
jgi:hypothetical protein